VIITVLHLMRQAGQGAPPSAVMSFQAGGILLGAHVIWSDAGAADPVAAADWVSRLDGTPPVIATVSLGDPTSAAFADLVERCRQRPLIRSIRMRLVAGLSGRAAGGDVLDNQRVRDNLTLLDRGGLVATVEATSSQLGIVTRLAAEFPALKIVIDHLGWPEPRRQIQRPQPHPAHGRDLSHLARWVASQQHGNRNAGLFWAANRALETDPAADLSPLAAAARQAGLDDQEITRTLDSARRTGQPGHVPPDHQAEAAS
jgi:Amidohydrolase